jgi:hypothetical protein
MIKYLLIICLFIFESKILLGSPVKIIGNTDTLPNHPSSWEQHKLRRNHTLSRFFLEKISLYFDFIKSNPSMLLNFLYQMPKGGHLHYHLGGNLSAEDIISLGKKGDFCVDDNGAIFSGKKQCHNKIKMMNFHNLLETKQKFIMGQWTIKNIKNFSIAEHFFSIFKKINPIIQNNLIEVLMLAIMKASKENVSYMEITLSLDKKKLYSLLNNISWEENLYELRRKIKQLRLSGYITEESNRISELYQDVCWYKRSKAPKIEVRFLYAVNRNQEPKYVFAQLIKAFELCYVNPFVVGVNLVGAEYSGYATRDYKLHMKMIELLKRLYPKVKVSLHAGELSPFLVDSQELKYHIDYAISIANLHNPVGIER